MKLVLLCLVLNGGLLGADFCYATNKQMPPQFLSVKEMEKFWGVEIFKAEEFKPESFKSGNTQTRAAMVPDLLKRNLYIGQTLDAVEMELGEPDGSFNKGGETAYLLGSDNTDHVDHSVKAALAEHKDVLQLVFFTDKEGKKVESVKIHRKYCADSPPSPPDPPPIKIVNKDKKLGLEVTGEVAAALWNHMAELSGEKGEKKGDSMKCNKIGKSDRYKCSFTFDPDGVVEPR
jgi:hypothetical protein